MNLNIIKGVESRLPTMGMIARSHHDWMPMRNPTMCFRAEMELPISERASNNASTIGATA